MTVLVTAASVQAADQTIDIPPQRLTGAIAELSRQTQVEILLRAPGKEGEKTHRVRGHMTAATALERLIRGKGLSFRQLGPRLYLIETATEQPAVRSRGDARPASEMDIVVTARRRYESGDGVPLAISKLDPAVMRRQAVRDLSDLARILPGFVATGQASSATPLLVMRGQRRTFSEENRLPLVVYVDEVPLPNQAALSPLFDVASVELLRGPQGTLFGRNTTAGAVLIHSVMPGSDVPSYMEVDVGNFGQHRLEAALELPIGSAAALRLAGQRQRRDGFFRLLSGARVDDVHTDAFRMIGRLAQSDNFRTISSFEMLDGNESGSAQILAGVYPAGNARTAPNAPWFDCGAAPCDVDSLLERQQSLGGRISQSGLAPRFIRRFRSLSNITEYGDDAFMLRNIIGWRSVRVETALDGDATPLPINDVTAQTNLRQWSEEFQVQGRTGRLRFIAGIFYLDSAPNGPMLQHAAQFERPGNPAINIANYQFFRSTAIFGQGTLMASDQLSFDLGLRYTSESTEGCSLRSAVLTPNTFEICVRDGGSMARARSGRLTWTAALNRRVGNMNLYLTSRRAFRSGGYNSPTLGQNLAPFQTFRPETLTDLEAGAKGEWSRGGMAGRFTLAGYVGFYDNIQRALFAPPDFDGDDNAANDPITLFINLARARIMGLDADLSVRFGTRTRVALSASYVNGRYTRVSAPPVLEPLLGNDPINNRFSYAPGFGGTISLSQAIPLPQALGTLELSADYSHSSSIRYAERANDALAIQPAYGLLGASIGWHRIGGGALDLDIWGRNLTDRSYASGGVMLNPTYTIATVIPGSPRTFGLRLRYSFD